MVEILLSTYNGDKFLNDFLNSLLTQSYKNWKLIVRDDGSKDKTIDILESFSQKYPEKVEIIKDSMGNLGPWKSFFHLLKYSKEKYVMFADQDDIWLPKKIEITLNKMILSEKKFGENYPILIHTDLKVVDQNLNNIAESFWQYQNLNPEHKSLNYLLVQNNVTGCTVMINKSLKNLINPFPTKAIMHDRWIAIVASAFGTINYVPESTILYRQHNNQNIGARKYSLLSYYKFFIKNPQRVRDSIIKTIEQAEEFLKIYNYKLNKEQKDMLNFYIQLPKLSKKERIKNLIKWKMFKQGKIRNIGFILNILSL
jgi:glycosyltransferase involved in cell wall biosynthesis